MDISRSAIEQALADYHLSDTNSNSDEDSKTKTKTKYSSADILSPTIKSPIRGNVEEVRQNKPKSPPANVKSVAHTPSRPSALRRQSSLNVHDRNPGRLRLTDAERIAALKKDVQRSRDNSERHSMDVPRPVVGKDDFDDFMVKEPITRPKIEELKSDAYGTRDYYSLDIPRAPMTSAIASPISEQSTGGSNSKYDSVAAEFGLGPINREDLNEYLVWNASLSNMRVCPVSLHDGSYFYVETRSFIPKRPGVTIHEGSEKTGRILGVAHLDYFSTNNMMGVGDTVGDPVGVHWHILHRAHANVTQFLTHVKYTFQLEDQVTGQQRKFEWHRTKNLPILDDQGDLVLIETNKSDVLAEYKGKGPMGQVSKQRGNLKIRRMEQEVWGKEGDWEMLVLLSWAGIVEMSRRRARMRRSSVFRAGIF